MEDAEPGLAAPSIPGVDLTREIGRGGRSRVFLARRDGREYAVKIAGDPGDASLRRRFMREAAALACLRHPALPRIFAVGEVDDAVYTVMERIDGADLEQLLRSRGALDERSTVALAIAVARGLDAAHAYGLIHRDVKPANILVPRTLGAGAPDFAAVRLIDFDLVTRARAQATDGRPDEAPEVVHGTLAYCPPEQSGMIHRPVDARSDLYALGVVIYECLAGRPPFAAVDASELLRLHAIAEPPALADAAPATSLAIRAIVRALLAKDPDERYASGAALADDLERIDAIDAELRAGGRLRLARAKTRPRRAAMVGRRGELARLGRAWSRVRDGRTSTVVLDSEAGLGKRLLISRWRGETTPPPTVLVARSELGQAIAFAPLRRALEGWLAREGGDEATAATLRASLGDLLGPLARFAPAFAALAPEGAAGREEARDDDGGDEAYLARVAELLASFVTAVGPTVLLAENIEWLDEASVQVLRRVAIEHAETRLLVLGTHRPGRGRSLIELGRALAPAELETIELLPLTAAEIQRYVELYVGAELDAGVGAAILGRTGGAPDAIAEYVRLMLDGWALRPTWTGWLFDQARLDALDLPTSFQAALAQRLAALADDDRRLVAAAAVLGPEIDAPRLAEALEIDRAVIDQALAHAVERRILTQGPDGPVFVHDYVRERLSAGVDPEARGALHGRMAALLDRRPGPRAAAEVYALAWHYRAARGAPPDRVVAACVRAGALAAEAHAIEDAYAFYQAAAAVLAGGGPLPRDLARSLGQVCQRSGRTDAAVDYYRQGIAATSDALDRAELRSYLAETLSYAFRFPECHEVAAAAFGDLEIAPPRAGLRSLATTLGALSGRGLRRLRRRSWGAADPEGERRRAAILRLLSALNFAAFLELDGAVAVQAGLRQYAITDGEAATREQAIGTQAVASTYAVLGRRKAFARMTDAALAQAEASGDRAAIAQVLLSRAFGLGTLGDDAGAVRAARRGLELGRRWLGPYMFANGARVLAFSLYHQGRAREALECLRRGYQRLQLASRGDGDLLPHVLLAVHASAHAAAGEVDRARELLAEARERLATVGEHDSFRGTILSAELRIDADLGGDSPQVPGRVRALLDLNLDPTRLMLYHREWYLNAADALLRRAWTVGADPETGALLRELRAVLERVAGVPLLAARCRVIDAAYAYFFPAGAVDREALFAQLAAAEAAAQAIDAPRVLAEAAWLRALAERDRGRDDASRREARRALAIAEAEGDRAFALLVRRAFAERSSSSSSARRTPSTATISRDQASLDVRLRRHFDALLAVSLSSSRARSPHHQAAMILDATIAMLGAERGFLFLREGDDADFDFAGGRDAQGRALETLEGYSRSLVEAVWRAGAGQVLSANERGVVDTHRSVVAHGLRSVIAAPLLLGDRRLGVVCLDSRLAAGVFTDDDLEILQAVANHIALALETARAVALDRSLREAEQVAAARLDRAASAVGLAVALVDPRFRLAHFGEALKKITAAWPHPEAWWDAIRAQLEETAWQLVAAMSRPGGQLAVDLRRPDGERQVFELTTTGELEGDDADARALILVADVTPRFLARERLERLNRELADARDQALAASRTKTTFLMAMSHELRTPLNAVIGYNELVLDELEDPQLRSFLESSLASSRGLLELIQDVLEYSNLEAGSVEAYRRRFAVAAFVDERVEAHRAAAEANGNAIRGVVDGGPFTVVSDRGRLALLVDKLLANAVKFTRGGEVTLRASRRPAAAGRPARLELRVEDTGVGIDEATREALFQPFVQADSSPTRAHGGAGLGLALVRQLIRLLGGELWVDSAPGVGSTFTVELPLDDDAPA
ncbi:MAG: ATP-binding protein [Nannocystaceae bacterium]